MRAAAIPALTVTFAVLASAQPTAAEEIEGFTEPYRQVDLAASDTGLVESIYVEEGDGVTEGELVARLDSEILAVSRRIAERHVTSHGKLDSARADRRLRQARVDKFRELLTRSHATQEELDRAEIELDMAAASVLTAEEENAIRKLEADRIAVQLERRAIRSPISGVVVERKREVGEFVSPADPVVMTVVQLNPLRATFNVPEEVMGAVVEGERATVTMLRTGEVSRATVEFVSPVIDSESGTARVRVRIPNADRTLRAGERCTLRIGPERLAGR